MEKLEHPFGYIENDKVYLKPFLSYSSRVLGEVKESVEKAFEYFEERFAKYAEKVQEVKLKVQTSDNKGSFLMKIQHLREQAATYNGLGDYQEQLDILNLLESQIDQEIEQNRKKNLELKQVLLKELEAILDRNTFETDRQKVKEIQQRWIRVGKVEDSFEEEFEKKFKELTFNFFETLKEHFEAKKELFVIREEKYKTLINEAQKLLDNAVYDIKTADKFKKLYSDWKEVGFLAKEQYDPLIESFKNIGNSFFNALKKNKNKSRHQSGDNVEIKKTIVSDLEKLVTSSFPNISRVESENLMKQWKKTGNTKDKAVYKEYQKWVDCIQEISFLMYTTKKQSKNFDSLNPAQQKDTLLRNLNKQIAKDEADISMYSENSSNVFNTNEEFNKMLEKSLNDKTRKLEAKKFIKFNLISK